jgi:hypothetical protein
VTAPTGIAACNIGGTTLHSFAGVGPGDETAEKMAGEVARRSQASARWKAAKVLIIDEVSMLDGDLFDKLEVVARHVRHNMIPFGGIQLVLAGDFFQLPPVGLGEPAGGSGGGGGGRGRGSFRGRGGGQYGYGGRGGGSTPKFYAVSGADPGAAAAAASSSSGGQAAGAGSVVKFCFEAACWNRVLKAQVSLQTVFRQRDAEFVAVLNQMRVGIVSPQAEALLAGAGREIAALESVRGLCAHGCARAAQHSVVPSTHTFPSFASPLRCCSRAPRSGPRASSR